MVMTVRRVLVAAALTLAACASPTAPAGLPGRYTLLAIPDRGLPSPFVPGVAGVDLVLRGGSLAVGSDDSLRVTFAVGPAGDTVDEQTNAYPYRQLGDSLVIPGRTEAGGHVAGSTIRLSLRVPVSPSAGTLVITEQTFTFQR